jgi:hypothetical protein
MISIFIMDAERMGRFTNEHPQQREYNTHGEFEIYLATPIEGSLGGDMFEVFADAERRGRQRDACAII